MKNLIKKTNLLIIFLMACSHLITGQNKFKFVNNTKKLADILDSNQAVNEPGYSLIVIKGDSIIYSKHSGYANIESKTKVDNNTPFYLASISKTFTAASVLKLWEEEKIALDSRISDYFNDLPPLLENVRIIHLLNHTSGIPDYFDAFENDISIMTNEDIYSYVKGLSKLEFEPGVSYSYSNTAYVLLSLIIEKVTNIKYNDFLNQRIFQPLSMKSAFTVLDSDRKNDRAIGYSKNNKSDKSIKSDVDKILTYGAGGIFCSASDLSKWYSALINGNFIKRKSLNLMFEFPTTMNGSSSWMSMGWFNETYGRKTPTLEGLKVYGAIGQLNGFFCTLNYFKDHDFAYIRLSNSDNFPIQIDIGEIYFKKI